MAFVLFEDASHFDLLPLTYTRPLYGLRCGILNMDQRWEQVFGAPLGRQAYDYLQPVFGQAVAGEDLTWINGKFVPEPELIRLVRDLPPGTAWLTPRGELLAARSGPSLPDTDGLITPERAAEMGLRSETVALDPPAIRFPEDIFALNRELIAFDFPLVTGAAPSAGITDPHTRVYGADNIYVAPGAQTRAAILNAEDGPIYLGPHSLVSEGTIVRNSHALLAHAVVAPGAKLRGDTTVGPWSKAGGEVTNTVIMGYSNKGHDGYLGNAVLGYWCNIGADSNSSNLKNNYANVKLWHYPSGCFRDTGRQFCGLIMGDHSKCGINTMLNTGTVVGVSANIFGAGFPRVFIPSFAWGGAHGFSSYRIDKALEVARLVMSRRGLALNEQEQAILTAVYERSAPYRRWEH
ncbi:MAG: glucose-1-phosphate thymidylyltransferase [Bacteroidetes bacterium]|nr:MAG: glucose-1-phosphate thymidylyltransferase [Bacteroidota bacterium]